LQIGQSEWGCFSGAISQNAGGRFRSFANPQDSQARQAGRAKRVDLVYLVCLVHLVSPISLIQPNKRDRPNEQEKPAWSRTSRAGPSLAPGAVIFLLLSLSDCQYGTPQGSRGTDKRLLAGAGRDFYHVVDTVTAPQTVTSEGRS